MALYTARVGQSEIELNTLLFGQKPFQECDEYGWVKSDWWNCWWYKRLDWMSFRVVFNKIKVKRVSKRYKKPLSNSPISGDLPWSKKGTNPVAELENFISFWDASPFSNMHFYKKLKSFEDNDKFLNKTIFTSGCDDCDFESLHHKWRYLSAKDFVQALSKIKLHRCW